MSRPKLYNINLTDEQISNFKNALHTGAPLMVALSYACISPTYYTYLLQVASISAYNQELKKIKEEDMMIKSGINMSEVQNDTIQLGGNYSKISAFHQLREPTPESQLRYKNNVSFRMFCDKVYDLMNEWDKIRAEITLFHLDELRKHSGKRGVNTNGSQWFLERTMPDYFGRVEKNKIEGNVSSSMSISGSGDGKENEIPAIKVEFVDPKTKENNDRIKNMEDLISKQINGNEA